MLNAEWVTYELSLSAEMTMQGISRLHSQAAWQAQFREMQRSEQPDHLAIKAALHKLVMDVTSIKLLPDHVSETIKACFLVSEVKLEQHVSLCVAIIYSQIWLIAMAAPVLLKMAALMCCFYEHQHSAAVSAPNFCASAAPYPAMDLHCIRCTRRLQMLLLHSFWLRRLTLSNK